MPNRLILRPIQQNDFPALEKIICDTWHFEQYADKKLAPLLAKAYLASCCADQTFTQVALSDGVPVGVIMGKNCALHKTSLLQTLRLFKCGIQIICRKGGFSALRFFSKVACIDDELLQASPYSYEGELSFFAVDSQYRGLGIGKSLYHSFLQYAAANNITHYYLYTDTDCNFGFYESRGLHRRVKKDYTVALSRQTLTMQFYLYDNVNEA